MTSGRSRDAVGRSGVELVVSGGQTGADRAALDVALELGIPVGGWCPAGRRAEDGRVPDRYPLREHPSSAYPPRTERNVRESDATLVLTLGPAVRGSALTLRLARRFGRPALAVDLDACDAPWAVKRVREWLSEHRPRILNVAGSRESTAPGIGARVREVLVEALR